MGKISKTARASQVQVAPKEVVAISDAEMVRVYRLNTEQGIFTGNLDYHKALFRAFDVALAGEKQLAEQILTLNAQLEDAKLHWEGAAKSVLSLGEQLDEANRLLTEKATELKLLEHSLQNAVADGVRLADALIAAKAKTDQIAVEPQLSPTLAAEVGLKVLESRAHMAMHELESIPLATPIQSGGSKSEHGEFMAATDVGPLDR